MNKKLPEKTSIVTTDKLYEVVYDKEKSETHFFSIDRFGKMETYLDKVELNGVTYLPISPRSHLLTKKVVLLPTIPAPYENMNDLILEIKNFIHKYLEVSEVFENIAVYFVIFTWLYDKFGEVPYLRAIGDFGSGKSRLLQTVGALCYKPMFTGGATTTSPIFRIIDEVHGTLVLDEADLKASDMSTDLVKILNSGYQKGSAVLRSEGKGVFEIKTFEVFGPKIIATRETFQDKALESRFLIEHMVANNLRKDIPRSLGEEFWQEAELIRNHLLYFRLMNFFKPIKNNDLVIEGIHPRLNQIILPLLSIIDDEKIKDDLVEFVKKYNKDLIEDRSSSYEAEIMLIIFKLQKYNSEGYLTIKEITDAYNTEFDLTDDRFEKMKPKKIGWYLRAKLQLKTRRAGNGWRMEFRPNKEQLEMWKQRFGITEALINGDDELVNDVNFTSIETQKDLDELNEKEF